MDTFQKKTLITKRSLKYTYYVSPAGEATKQHPALFFIHGFPDSARLWTDMIAKLGTLPNKIIAPDCLGYGGTDKPTDTKLYAYKGHAADFAEILAAENVISSVVIGHDWGSALAQRVYLHHRELFSGMILLNVAYLVPPARPLDLAKMNDLTEKMLGYRQYSYWELLTAPDGAEILNNNLERMWQVLHGDVEDWVKKMFCTKDAMREFLLGDKEVPLLPYAREPRWKDEFMRQFKTSGFEAPLQYYRANVAEVNRESDLTLPQDRLVIDVPLLYVICTRDAVCTREYMNPAKEQGLVPKLKEVVIDSAHWCAMEKPDEVAAHISDYLKENFS
ncbi:epoxide hydrolase [Xylariaceae sp. FL0255]|nr:epoxide hydrolase [Xylariaceae sp. FL0255]